MSAEPTPEEMAAATDSRPAQAIVARRLKPSEVPEIHRLLPQDVAAEKGVLSSYLLSPQDVQIRCSELGITSEHFYLPAHATIFSSLRVMEEERRTVDFITLTNFLRDRGMLDEVGGPFYVTDLGDFLPTASNVGHYLEILIAKHTLRKMIQICTHFAARSYDDPHQHAELLNELEARVLGIRKNDDAELRESNPKDLVMQVNARIEEMYDRRGEVSGLKTGFGEIDQMLNGLQPSDMIVIAARPSMGKTALAMNIAEHVAVVEKRTIAFFTLEMSDVALMERALLSRSRINLHRVRMGFLSDGDFPALTAAGAKLSEGGRLRIIDAVGASIAAIKAKARRLKRKFPDLAAIFLDYIQKCRSTSKQALGNREREIAEISAGLKDIAKELNIPVVVLAQLNRQVESRKGETKGRPQLSDLRESGAIEQDADIVGLLYREEYYAEGDEAKAACEGKATLIIAKNRNGPVGDIPLTFLKEFARYETRAREVSMEQRDFHQD